MAWKELSSSEGRCTAPGRELLPSPGGRRAIARLGRLPEAIRPLFSFPQGKKTIPPRLLLSPHTGREIAPLNPPGPPRQGKAITPQGR